jgi:hypothetical protein
VSVRVADSARQALGILSLMSHVGIERNVAQELSVLCAAFATDQNLVLNAIEPLMTAGFMRQDGSWSSLLPWRTVWRRAQCEGVRKPFVVAFSN